MRIVITKELEPYWGTPSDLKGLTDQAVVEMLQEDLPALVDGARWEVKRSVEEGGDGWWRFTRT